MFPRMVFVFNQSLEHRCIIVLGITLWSQNDINQLISDFCSSSLNCIDDVKLKFQRIEHSVIEKVAKLQIPDTLKHKLLPVIHGVGQQMLLWMEDHRSTLRLLVPTFPFHFSWTPHGIIDAEKTAERLVRSDSIDIYERFKLACLCCLEDPISLLWNQLESERKNLDYIREHENLLVCYWSYKLEGKLDMLRNRRRFRTNDGIPYMCMQLLEKGNFTAGKYFLKKMDISDYSANFFITQIFERSHRYNIREVLCSSQHTDVLCFLMAHASDHLQMRIFKRYPSELLTSLVDWPFHECFLDTACHLWNFLPPSNFLSLLKLICEKEKYYACKYSHFTQLFVEFWLASPTTFKCYVVSRIPYDFSIMLQLFETKNKESIKHILAAAETAEEKIKIISPKGFRRLYNHAKSSDEDTWDLLEFLIRECVSSRSDILNFKNTVIAYFPENELESERATLDSFFQRLDDI